MAQDNPYAKYVTGGTAPAPQVPAPQAPRAPAPPPFIPGVVSPTKQAADNRDEVRTGLAVKGDVRDESREDRETQKQGFNQTKDLRDEFSKSPPVLKYRTIIGQYSNASTAGENTAGDQLLINSYAQMLNPTSTVMLGEYDATAEVDATAERIKNRLKKEFGWDGAGRVSPQGRRWLLGEMQGIAVNTNNEYKQHRRYYEQLAQRNGADPFEVIGPHIGGAHFDTIKAQREKSRAGEAGDKPQGVRQVIMKGGVPQDTDIQFNAGKPEEAFDRSGYVQKTYGVTPQQEDLVIGFWNQNRENQGLSVDSVKQWYQQNNLPMPSDEALGGMVDNAKKGFQFGPFDTSAARQEYEDSLRSQSQKMPGTRGAAARDPTSFSGYNERINSAMLSGWGDEAAGIGGAIGNALTGNDPIQGYKRYRDMQRLMNQDQAESQGMAGTAIDIAGSMVGMRGAPSGLGGVKGAVASGATAGGVAGAGYGEGVGGTAGNALAGAVLGGGLGASLHGAGRAFQSRPGATTSNAGEIIAAGEREGVDVLTSDIRQPQTGFGKFVRRVGELTPLLGTGGKRAAQRTSRETAVRNLVAEFGDGTVDDVSANLVKTRGDMVERLNNAKKSVIEGIQGPVAAPRAVQAIDEQIANLRGINEEAYAPVIQKLESFKRVLGGDRNLSQIEENRKLLGSMFDDTKLASVKTGGQKALNAIYGPLREDMGVFIRSNAGAGAFNKWKGANDKLADMMDELDDVSFKRFLGKAETTPEAVGSIIFGKTPSTMRRLFNSVNDEGKNKIRAAIMTRALDDSSDLAGNVSPQKFANAIDAMDKSVAEFFPAAEKARLEGFKKLMAATNRAVDATSLPNNGAQLAPAAGTMLLTPYMGKEAGALVASQGLLGAAARLYETKAVRNILMALSRTRPGSPGEATMIDRLAKFAARNTANQAPQTERVQQAADQTGSTVPVIPQ